MQTLRHASLLLAADANTRWCQYWYFYYLCFAFDAIYSSFFRFYALDQYLNGTFLFLLITQNLFFLRFFPPFNASSHCPRTTNQINTDAAQKINACHSINVILFADISQQKQKNKATLLLNSFIQVFSFWDNWTVSHLATWMKDVSLLYKCNADRALLYFEVKFQ